MRFRFLFLTLLVVVVTIGCNDTPTAGNSSVDERVKAVIAMQLGLDQKDFTLSDSLQGKLGADDLDMVELVMELEEEFNIAIPDNAIIEVGETDIRSSFSGDDMARVVEQQLKINEK